MPVRGGLDARGVRVGVAGSASDALIGAGASGSGRLDARGAGAGEDSDGGPANDDATRGAEAGTESGDGAAACDGRALGTSDGSEGPSPVSGRPTARRLTTVGRIRSSTIDVLFCFSR